MNTGMSAFEAYMNRYTPEIDSFMREYYFEKKKVSLFPFMSQFYTDLSEYCLRPGKRIRPLLLLCGFDAYSQEGNTASMIPLASVIEMMHSFLLIQDDIIDKAATRRGGTALHLIEQKRFEAETHNPTIGNDVALVLADVLFSNTIEIIADTECNELSRQQFLKIFSQTYEMTAFGQILDCVHSMSRDVAPDKEIPLQISTLKTAYYTIYYPILMGYALAGDMDEGEQEAIREFSLPLGLAFQLRDDIIGVFAESEKTGKPNDADLLEGKFTLLVYETVERLSENQSAKFITILTSSEKSPEDIIYLRDTMVSSGGKDAVCNQLAEYITVAKEKLKNLNIKRNASEVLSGVITAIASIE